MIISRSNGPIRCEAVALGQGEDYMASCSLAATVQNILEEYFSADNGSQTCWPLTF